MSVWLHINPACADRAVRADLATFDAWMNAPAANERHSGRKESLGVLGEDRLGFRVYLKRYRPGTPRKRFFLRSSRQRREAENAMRLAEAGIPVAEVVAAGERRVLGIVTSAFVATREIANARPMTEIIAELWSDRSAGSRGARLALIEALASLVRRMHDLGYVDHDLHCRNLMVRGRRGARPEIFVLDSPRGSWLKGYPLRGQRRDLACLDIFAADYLSCTDRLRFYRAYKGGGRLDADDREAIAEILQRSERERVGDMTKLADEPSFARLVDGDTVMFIREDRIETLKRNGFATFDDFLDAGRGKVINRHEIRDVAVFDLDTPDGPRTVFLKRFGPMLPKDTLRDLLLLRRVRTKARIEARMIEEFRRRGFVVPEVLAFGERHALRRDRASFLLVEKLREGRAVEDLMKEVRDPARRMRIIHAVADFVRRMHDSGLTHKDLYGKHVFVAERADGECSVATIDLQRAAAHRSVDLSQRGRNLAALMVSIPPDTVAWRERREFLLRYLDADRLDAEALRFVRECIMPRARRLCRRRVYRAWMPVLGVSP